MSKEYFDFADVRFIPKKTIVDSRKDCKTEITLGQYKFKLGIVPANMATVISRPLAIRLAENSYFYIYHRFLNDTIDFIKEMNKGGHFVSISIGVNEVDYKILKEIKSSKLHVDYICLDVRHAYSIKAENMIKFIKDNFPKIFLIAGNIASVEGALALEEWGVDMSKAGIRNGSVCTTFLATSVGSCNIQAWLIKQLSKECKKMICSDGGIKKIGDISVAYGMGADLVMSGSLFTRFEDSPGEPIEFNRKIYKQYYGSRSQYNKGHNRYVEGKKELLDAKEGSLIDYLNGSVMEGVESCISYLGGKDMSIFNQAEYIIL